MTFLSADARDEILERLRRALSKPRPLFRGETGHAPSSECPTAVTQADGDRQSLAAQFGAKLQEVLGSYEILQRSAEVAERVVRRLEQWDALAETADPKLGEVLSWSPQELHVPDLERRLEASGLSLMVPDDLHDEHCRAHAATLSVGLTGIDAAFASTGSVMLASGPGKSRAASLLPLHHLMIVPMSRIYPTFEAWLRSLRRDGRLESFLRHSAQIAFITGPSKSADIELNLTLGVHGPRAVHAIVFDDTR